MNRNYEEITRNRLLEQVETQFTDEKVEELMGLEKLLHMGGFITMTVAEYYRTHWELYVNRKARSSGLSYKKYAPFRIKMIREINAMIEKYTADELQNVWYEIKDRIDEAFEELESFLYTLNTPKN